MCSPCKNGAKEADNYCTDCHDYYCSTCVKCHDDIPALSGHKILDKGHFETGTSEAIPVVPTERCKRHSFKPVDMYCQNHDDVGCYTCMAVEHRSCKDVFYIPEYVEGDKTAADSQEINRDLKKAEDDLKIQLDKHKEEAKRLLKRKVEEVEKVKEFRLEMERKLDALEKDTIDEIEKKYKVLIKRTEDDVCALTALQDDISMSQDSILSAGSNMSQQFVSLMKGKTATGKAKRCLEDKTSDFSRQEFVFDRNQQLLSNLIQETRLGKINQQHALYKLTGKKLYPIKHDSDTKTCSIYGACMIADGSVILADNSNKKLKHLDASSYKVDDVCDLSYCPWQICSVEKHGVAVSFHKRGAVKKIQFVSTEGKMKKTRMLETDHGCYGIAHKNGHLYITDSNTTVFVYNITGTKLKQFSKDQSGQPLFSDIYSLFVCRNDSEIYVTDSSYGLIVLDQDGKLLGKYNCPQLKHARGACDIDDANVLVCGESSNNIIQFSPNGAVVGEVLPSDQCNGSCRAICFDRQHSKIIVGHVGRDEIEIFDVA
ncbi:E3 ubiquitin-protein ligase TRIM71-like isoform X2 [Mercenaria mercenaria]|uniref:E3 ubiquitin-protein ligase TRIM71-like isoform X2 n=1 Tax=Mercenaria mercenaria TaxID=6596 RepID=UPI00234E3A7B|nr:E3 ubiquitin-protein ligase TRIM71-like isoform X2 [Mercenaria mercenaria]